MDAFARTTFGFSTLVIGIMIILMIRNGGPRARYYEDYSNIRGIRRIRLTLRLCYTACVIGIAMIFSGLLSMLLHGGIPGAS